MSSTETLKTRYRDFIYFFSSIVAYLQHNDLLNLKVIEKYIKAHKESVGIANTLQEKLFVFSVVCVRFLQTTENLNIIKNFEYHDSFKPLAETIESMLRDSKGMKSVMDELKEWLITQ